MITPTSAFDLRWPGLALFGAGRSDALGRELAARGHKVVLIVTDPGLAAAGVLARIERALEAGGVAHDAYAEVAPNPTTANVDAAYAMWMAGRYDALIAVGGGSAMDTAKGVMARIVTGVTAEEAYDLEDIDQGAGPTPFFACVPTTSGTGSESSLGAVLKSKVRKFVIRGERLRSRLNILDPELTLSLPPRMTAMTGFDAYCHAIGAFANNQTNPVTDELMLQSMRLLIEQLPRAVENGGDLAAREAVMLGSYLAGIGIAQKGVDAIHGLATPVESMVNATHGEVLGVIMPHMLAYNLESLTPRYAMAARRLGLVVESASDAKAADALVAASMRLQALTGGIDRLGPLGIEVSMTPQLVEMALMSRATGLNGRALAPENIGALYQAMI